MITYNPKKHTLFSLQFLRGLAALFIVILHSLENLFDTPSNNSLNSYDFFGVGVDIFFVISGFVMEYLTGTSHFSLSERLSAGLVFLKKRIIRVVPLYWFYTTLKVCLLLLFPFLALRTTFDSKHILFSYLFIPSTAPWGLIQPFLPVGWTLNFEMLFYLVFAVGIFLGLNRVIFATLIFITISLLSNFYEGNIDILSFYSRPIIFEFVGGMIIANMFRYEFLKITIFESIVILLTAIAYLIFIYTYKMPDFPRVINVGVPAFLVVYAMLNIETYLISSKLFLQLAKFGDSSYTTYLLHTFIVPAVPKILYKVGIYSKPVIFIFCILITMSLSWLAYIYLEKRILKLFN